MRILSRHCRDTVRNVRRRDVFLSRIASAKRALCSALGGPYDRPTCVVQVAAPRNGWDKTAAYIALATVGAPLFGFLFLIASAIIFVPALQALSGRVAPSVPAAWIVESLRAIALVLINPSVACGTATGACFGALIAKLRGVPNPVRWRSDVLGGALGGAAYFLGPVVYTRMTHMRMTSLTELVWGFYLYAPHLYLTGLDYRKLNPPRATSACGAAPSAPSR